ncbi:MAG: polysaccharide biosynthesis protein [Lachnospiraceae bacterium]|nr:polysaccharide biosynthesis protein [Lachnospiraceae bacterium]
MKHKNPLVQGALLLTIAGFLTRIIGFFYRIFLSRTIGAEGMGLYQLIFPIYGIVSSISIASVQTSVSRYVAAEQSAGRKHGAKNSLLAGVFLSLSVTLLLSIFVYYNAEWIAIEFLKENRCTTLVRILAFSLPFSSIHSCINGYYYGMQKTAVPSISQLAEQVLRVLCVYIMSMVSLSETGTISPKIAVIGIVIGEAASMLFCVFSITLHFNNTRHTDKKTTASPCFVKQLKNIFVFSLPLSFNRLLLSVLHSIEAVLIPTQLKLFGMSSSEAISLFGIFTGMAMPFIQFPSAIPNAIAVLLLPEVAAAAELNVTDKEKGCLKLRHSSESGIRYSLLLGILCVGIFVVFGNDMGIIIFNNRLAGLYITILAWLCPFLYLSTTLGSILNGLSETTAPFIHSVISILIRLTFVFFAIPKYGIVAYLIGTLISQIVMTGLHYFKVRKKVSLQLNAMRLLVWPTLILLVSLFAALTISMTISLIALPSIVVLGIKCATTGLIYIALIYFFKLLN